MYRLFIALVLSHSCAWAEEPPQAVTTTIAQEVNLNESVTGVGTFTAYNDVTLKAEIAGRIETIHFKDGDRAKPNQLLFTLHNNEQKAKLKKAEATVKLSRNILKRKKELAERKFVSPQDLEQAQTQLEGDLADLALAKEELEKTQVRAPFDGVLSLRNVSMGSYVIEADELVRLQDITPIRLVIQITEKDIPMVKPGGKVIASTDVYPGNTFEGVIEAIDPSVNEETRSVSVYATFDNKEEHLIPGLYGRAQLVDTSRVIPSLYIPEQALVIRPDGNFVFKRDGNKARLTKVTIGRRSADQAEILSGLKKGDEIVLEGHDKIHDGSPITISNKKNDK